MRAVIALRIKGRTENRSVKTEADRKIENETTFLFNGIQFRFRLDNYTREFGYLLARFHVITDIDIAKDFMENKMFFEGELLNCGIPLKCYLAGISREGCSECFKVDIVGEEIH